MCSKLVQMSSNVFKFVQNLLKCVQMYSNVFKCVQMCYPCSKLVQMCSCSTEHVIKRRCTKGITLVKLMFQGGEMYTWKHLITLQSVLWLFALHLFNQFHITYQGTNYHPFQCKGSDMPNTIWSSFIWILSLKRRVVRVMSTEYWSQLDSDIPEVRIKKETEIGQSWDNFQHSVCSFLNFGVWKMISLSFPCSPIETSIIVTLTRCLS